MLSRRDFLAAGLAVGALPIIGRAQPQASGVFKHGVASGDPLSNRVVLWTRVTPTPGQSSPIDVGWMIAPDPRMSRVVGRGNARTSPDRDFTVKVDVGGLEPGATYYYRFFANGEQSVVGRTRTLPLGRPRRVRLALASCANHPFGFFNVYARIAARADLDAVLHLGDYIYEYANNSYGNRQEGDGTALGRVPAPNRELLSLADYRARYAQYREDPDLQAAHRQHPFIVIWDDHEFANDAWAGGAPGHTTAKGNWLERRGAAARAWREWLPVRDIPGIEPRTYRRFTFGNLADVLMLDSRIVGRDAQASRTDTASLERANRQILGSAQEDWLFGTLEDSRRAQRPWQVLGQQVMFAPQAPPGTATTSEDSWDGYRAARQRVFDTAAASKVDHLVVVTGDAHSSWAYDVARDPFDPAKYNPQTGKGAIGTELVAPAVTSPGWFTPEQGAKLLAARPHLRYLEGQHRGFVVLDLTPERLQADWWFVPSVAERTADVTCAKSLVSEAARPHLTEATGPLATGDAREPAPESI
jgi:alkaline phosphatase D